MNGVIAAQHWQPVDILNLIVVLLFQLELLLLSLLFLLLLLFHGLIFAGSDISLPLPFQVKSPRTQEDWDCPRGASPPTGLGHFRGLHLIGTHPSNASTPSPNSVLFHLTPRLYHPVPSSRCLLRYTAWSAMLPAAGTLPPGHPIMSLAHQGFGNPFFALAGLQP